MHQYLFVSGGVFIGVRLIWMLVFSFKKDLALNDIKMPNYLRNIIIVLGIIISLALLMQWFCVGMYNEYPYYTTLTIQRIPVATEIVLIIVMLFQLFCRIRSKKDIPAYSLATVYVICLILYFVSLFCVSFFRGDSYHGIAAMETVFNVYDLIPFSDKTSGIYGHYGLFFLIPMRLFGGTMVVASATMSFYGCVACAAILYAIHKIMPTNWLRVLAAFASIMWVAVLRPTNYWQLQPIRILFPALLCAYAVYLNKYKKTVWMTRWMWLGYLICTLGIVWNTETGIVCILAFSFYMIFEWLGKYKWYKGFKIYLSAALLSAGGCLCAIVIVNLYNLFCGGGMILKTFFYPMSVVDMVDIISYAVPSGNYPWIYALIIFFVTIGWGVTQTTLFKNSEKTINGA